MLKLVFHSIFWSFLRDPMLIFFLKNSVLTDVQLSLNSLVNCQMPFPVVFLVDPLVFKKRKLPWQCTKSEEVDTDKAWKIKSVYNCTYRQISDVKSFATQIVSLNSCELFLAVLVYMQEHENCSHKTWHICIEVVSNDSSKISFVSLLSKFFIVLILWFSG